MAAADPPRRLLTHSEIVAYLLERELLKLRSAVGGNLRLSDVSRRNCNTRVENTRGRSFLVKQAVGFDADRSLRTEAGIYRWIYAAPRCAGLRKYLPRFHWYDSARGLLILELLGDCEDLERVHSRGRFPVSVACAQAGVLALLHGARPRGEGLWAGAANSAPWVFNIDSPTLPDWLGMSRAASRVVGVIQRDSVLVDGLRVAAALWRPKAFTHGDFRWANQLAVPGATNKAADLKLVDWEYGDQAIPPGTSRAPSAPTWVSG